MTITVEPISKTIDDLKAERDLWRQRAEGAAWLVMMAYPDGIAGDLVEWMAELAKEIEELRKERT